MIFSRLLKPNPKKLQTITNHMRTGIASVPESRAGNPRDTRSAFNWFCTRHWLKIVRREIFYTVKCCSCLLETLFFHVTSFMSLYLKSEVIYYTRGVSKFARLFEKTKIYTCSMKIQPDFLIITIQMLWTYKEEDNFNSKSC